MASEIAEAVRINDPGFRAAPREKEFREEKANKNNSLRSIIPEVLGIVALSIKSLAGRQEILPAELQLLMNYGVVILTVFENKEEPPALTAFTL